MQIARVVLGLSIILLVGCAAFPKGDCVEGSYAIYGNWCGPAHPKSGACKPVNWVDAACKVHDDCYAKNGYLDCDCDEELVDTLEKGKLVYAPLDRKYTFLWLGENSPIPNRRQLVEVYFENTLCRKRDVEEKYPQ